MNMGNIRNKNHPLDERTGSCRNNRNGYFELFENSSECWAVVEIGSHIQGIGTNKEKALYDASTWDYDSNNEVIQKEYIANSEDDYKNDTNENQMNFFKKHLEVKQCSLELIKSVIEKGAYVGFRFVNDDYITINDSMKKLDVSVLALIPEEINREKLLSMINTSCPEIKIFVSSDFNESKKIINDHDIDFLVIDTSLERKKHSGIEEIKGSFENQNILYDFCNSNRFGFSDTVIEWIDCIINPGKYGGKYTYMNCSDNLNE